MPLQRIYQARDAVSELQIEAKGNFAASKEVRAKDLFPGRHPAFQDAHNIEVKRVTSRQRGYPGFGGSMGSKQVQGRSHTRPAAQAGEPSLKSTAGDQARIQSKSELLREEDFTTKDIELVRRQVPDLNVVLLRSSRSSSIASMAEDAAELGGALKQPVVFKFRGLVTIATPGKDAQTLIHEHEQRLTLAFRGKPGKMAA